MADKKVANSWAEKTGSTNAQPRMVFSDHMIVFATTGARTSLTPERLYDDGFNQPNQPIYIVGPEDLRPENHEKLKAILAAKVAEAKKLPFSERERKEMKETFTKSVILEAVLHEPLLMIEHFSPQVELLQETYGSAKSMAQVATLKADNMFSPYRATEIIRNSLNDDIEIYKQTKALFRKHGKQAEFEQIEAEIALDEFSRKLNHLNMDDAQKQAIMKQSVHITRNAEGKQRLSVDVNPLSKLYHQYINENYADLDKVINDARSMMVEMAKDETADPFAQTIEEHAMSERIQSIAQKDIRAKPVVLAGYNDPNLLIIVDSESNGRYVGRSYPGQNMIQVICSRKVLNNFDHTVREELMHQGVDKIYKNFSLPYVDDTDMRRELLETAMKHDMKSRREYSLLGLSRNSNYDVRDHVSMQQEVPVKVMLYMDDHDRDEIWGKGATPFAATETFVNEVVIKDAIAYNRKQPLHHIGADYTRETRPVDALSRQLPSSQHRAL
jgi:hypothetical protein